MGHMAYEFIMPSNDLLAPVAPQIEWNLVVDKCLTNCCLSLPWDSHEVTKHCPCVPFAHKARASPLSSQVIYPPNPWVYVNINLLGVPCFISRPSRSALFSLLPSR